MRDEDPLRNPWPPPSREEVSSLDAALRPLVADLMGVVDRLPDGADSDTVAQAVAEFRRLRGRLAAAETALVLYSWTPGGGEDTAVEKATYEAWRFWLSMTPAGYTDPDAHPHLSKEAITAMAAERDAIRARTLKRIHERYPDLPPARTVAEEVMSDGNAADDA